MPKKTERGTLWDFSTSILSQNIKKMQGGPFVEKFFFEKKVSQCRKKNERGESLVSPGMVCYAEKQEKPFWFSSLDQIVHFDAIIFCRTFVELFWSVRVDRKKKSHYNSRVSLHEAPTKNESNGFHFLMQLSQPAPGLGCHCRRVGIGRGHGCSRRFPKWYFNY